MTLRIPLRAIAFVLYTLALLGGAFGISYAVFEWRDDDASAIDERFDKLEQGASAGPTRVELDAQRCEAALEAMGVAASGGGFIVPPLFEAVDRYCK